MWCSKPHQTKECDSIGINPLADARGTSVRATRGELLTITSQHRNHTFCVHIHDALRPLRNLSREHLLGKVILQQAHDGTTQRARTIRRGETFVDKTILEALRALKGDVFLLQTLEHILEHDVRDFANFLLVELTEHNDFIKTVKELGTEVVLEILHD